MAELTVILTSPDGKKYIVDELTSLEFLSDTDAACDGLKLTYLCGSEPFEVNAVELYSDGKKVFFGYCDKQRYRIVGEDFSVFIYARSSAALLVDNEAQPTTYNAPDTAVLFHCEAEQFGFINKLPALGTEHEYTVPKGCSCYGAINTLVKTLGERKITVTPENKLTVPDGKGIIRLDEEKVISETKCINRALPFTQIDYKLADDSAYIRHYKSRLAEGKSIRRTRKINIAALPRWQREYELKDRLGAGFESYIEAEVVIDGIRFYSLYDRAEFHSSKLGINGEYELCKIAAVFNSNESSTHLTFRKRLDIKEINYVAE